MPGEDRVGTEADGLRAQAAEIAAQRRRTETLTALPTVADARAAAIDGIVAELARMGATVSVVDTADPPYPDLVAAFSTVVPDSFWASRCWVREVTGSDGTATIVASELRIGDGRGSSRGRLRAESAATAVLDDWGRGGRWLRVTEPIGPYAPGVAHDPTYRRVEIRLTSTGHAFSEVGTSPGWGSEASFREACATALANDRV